MADLLLYSLASYGLCHILMYGKILSPLRDRLVRIDFFNELLSCALCTGFWTGLFIGILSHFNPIIFALYSSTFCFVLHLVTEIMLKKAYSKET
jgi:cytochrome c biogenesis protein CcdA